MTPAPEKLKIDNQVKTNQQDLLKLVGFISMIILLIYFSFKVESKTSKVILIIVSVLLTGFLIFAYSLRNLLKD